MTVRRIDDVTGDIVTSGVQFIAEKEEVAQTIKTRLRLFFGEYFRDITDGTPWFQTILGKGSSVSVKDASIKRRIAQTKNVISVLSYETDYDITARTYEVQSQVLTTFGEIELTTSGSF